MEEKSKNRSRKRKTISEFGNDPNTIIFGLLLASLSNPNSTSNSLIQKCLNKLRLSLLSKSPNQNQNQTLPIPILSLLPILLLLHSNNDEIVIPTAEIVGAASLFSLEMNQQLASDDEIVKALISSLAAAAAAANREVLIAVCNAVLDLSTTSIGRHRLLQFSCLETLMFKVDKVSSVVTGAMYQCENDIVGLWGPAMSQSCKMNSEVTNHLQQRAVIAVTEKRFGFLQVPKSSKLVSLCNVGEGTVASLKIGFKEDELPVLLLNAAIILINTCNNEQLEKIPRKLSESFLVFLKELWGAVRNQMLVGSILKSNQEIDFYLSNIRINNLAESIFRLSINTCQFTTPSTCEVVKRSIFGLSESSFKDFMLNHWEASPFLVRELSRATIEKDDVFSSFIESLNCKESVPSFLSSILQSMVSCPPIASDELNILSFLKEMGAKLGFPIIYQQDIRVLRTEEHSAREVHFFQQSSDSYCIKAPQYFCIEDILKCEEAYKEGYTIALRGMEFRFKSIAAIADGLASLFGQPSVGANIYLTPPNSQGLAQHYDDHCVFVCQLFGTKQWKISSHPNIQLPRLYDPLDSLQDSEIETSMAVCTQISLREGDVLYIPRGFSHEACTDNCEHSGSAGFSLHLTLGIEVEPPFEWEGFAHIALYCWNQTQKQTDHASVKSLSGILNVMSVNLLHVMIGVFGESDPIFRKACLVAAISFPEDTKGWLDLNQKIIFNHLITKISSESRFLEALKSVEVAIQKNEDPFQRMRWLQLLSQERETIDGYDWNIPLMGIENLLPVNASQKDMAEMAFMQVKSKFCSEVLLEDVIESYMMLLEKYKKARKQYMNGMVSLHFK